MMKLLYPDGKMTDAEAFELVDFAAESRKRVKDQLYVIDETFKAEPAFFKYINLKNGMEINVETLEKVSNALDCPRYVAPTQLTDRMLLPTETTKEDNAGRPTEPGKASKNSDASVRKIFLSVWDRLV